MLNLQATIDKNSGFCFGVLYAIEMAEEILERDGTLYCLGDIVHNEEEVERLRAKGLQIISHEDLPALRDVAVLIRAHGEPPSTYELALKNNLTLLDASCPVVLKLQERVRDAVDEQLPIYIFGKHGHAEVAGLQGQTGGTATVFADTAELDPASMPRKVALFSQTTKSTKRLYEVRDWMTEQGIEVSFNDTICRQVSNRDVQLQSFANQFDTVLFVSGKKSSNGKVLYEVCKALNPNTHFVSSANEVDPAWFGEGQKVGIAGATSTPQWLMEDVKTFVETL